MKVELLEHVCIVTRELGDKRPKHDLIKEYRLLFGKGASFDFDNKRIVSSDGKLALQWMLRDRPDQPESYRNQQTNQGVVRLVKLKEN